MWTVFLLIACVAMTTSEVRGQLPGRSKYNVKTFPDPIDRYQACGRPFPSFVCDPTNILSEVAANLLDDDLKKIYNETTVPCYSSGPRASRRRGYIVMVAMVPEMDRLHTVNNPNYTINVRYHEAQFFSYYLGNQLKWGKHSSQCNEMVIIFYSQQDGVLYTSTQSTARRLLTDDVVRTVNMDAMPMYYPFTRNKGNLADAITYIARRYGDVLREEVNPAQQQK
ncbi:uncharacterized protein LOC127851846 [Dreissena polymorpha]|uniref:Uncharacterized protein n=1 Tax=Dreissena polymorpha TaxID=45954 RepID=A0A9D4I114_DREPO|nr:uncharacterized protein LOC127851846 [Dreissena polymorpha]KAH3738431.1 hypothetical protein DPMN_045065 [Dreissena polymorpha]